MISEQNICRVQLKVFHFQYHTGFLNKIKQNQIYRFKVSWEVENVSFGILPSYYWFYYGKSHNNIFRM